MDEDMMSEYLKGLCHMASACSKGIGPSYISAECFDGGMDELPAAFEAFYELPRGCLKLTETDMNLQELFEAWFGVVWMRSEAERLAEVGDARFGDAEAFNRLKAGISNDLRLISDLLRFINLRVGEPGRVWGLPDGSKVPELMSDSEGLGPFYMTEDLCFVEFDGMVACFMIGNDE